VTKPPSIDDSRRRHPSTSDSPDERFAHPSERAFAHLLTLYGHSWSYEPLEFPPDRGLFIELTVLEQRLVTKKNQKVRQFRALYPEVDLLVVYQRDFVALLKQHGMGTIATLAA
jgi:hypothetical protein